MNKIKICDPFSFVFVLATSFKMAAGKKKGPVFFWFSQPLVSSFFSALQCHHLFLVWLFCSLVLTHNHRGPARAVGGSNPCLSRTDLTEGHLLCLISVGAGQSILGFPLTVQGTFSQVCFFWRTCVWLQPATKGSEIQCSLQLGST